METAAASGKGVTYQGTGLGEGFYQWQKRRERFFCRMQLVAAISKLNHITDGVGGFLRKTFRQHVSAFVLITQMARGGSITLREYQMPDDAEACGLPGSHEAIHMRPAIEANAEGILCQNTVHLSKGRFQPGIIVIILDTTASAIFV